MRHPKKQSKKGTNYLWFFTPSLKESPTVVQIGVSNRSFVFARSFCIKAVGFFTVSKSDRRSVREINCGKINLLKKVASYGTWTPNSNHHSFEVWYITNVAIKICVEWDALNEFSFMHHYIFWTFWLFLESIVCDCNLKALPFNTCLDCHIG